MISFLPQAENQSKEEEGFTLIELLVAILILSVMSMGVAQNTISALRTAKFTEFNHAASSLAIAKMEELAALNVTSITNALNDTETAVVWADFQTTFTRTTTVVVNADNSRSVTVEVSSNSLKIPTTVDFSTTFANWE